jgi:hypothetical protein
MLGLPPQNPHLVRFNNICRNFILFRNGIIATQWFANIAMDEITEAIGQSNIPNLWEKMMIPIHQWPWNKIFHANTVRATDTISKAVTLYVDYNDPARTATTAFNTASFFLSVFPNGWGAFYENRIMYPAWEQHQRIQKIINSNECPSEEDMASLRTALTYYKSWSYNTFFTAPGSHVATWVAPENVIRPVGDIIAAYYFQGWPGVDNYFSGFGPTFSKIVNMYGLGYHKTGVIDVRNKAYNSIDNFTLMLRNGTICKYSFEETLDFSDCINTGPTQGTSTISPRVTGTPLPTPNKEHTNEETPEQECMGENFPVTAGDKEEL